LSKLVNILVERKLALGTTSCVYETKRVVEWGVEFVG